MHQRPMHCIIYNIELAPHCWASSRLNKKINLKERSSVLLCQNFTIFSHNFLQLQKDNQYLCTVNVHSRVVIGSAHWQQVSKLPVQPWGTLNWFEKIGLWTDLKKNAVASCPGMVQTCLHTTALGRRNFDFLRVRSDHGKLDESGRIRTLFPITRKSGIID